MPLLSRVSHGRGAACCAPAWQCVNPTLLASPATLTSRPARRRHLLRDALLIPIPNNPQPLQSQKLIHGLNMPRSPPNQSRLSPRSHPFRLIPPPLLHPTQYSTPQTRVPIKKPCLH